MPGNASGSVKMPTEGSTANVNRSETKVIRVLTVIAYMCSVSMAAVMLSLYYVFLWNPEPPNLQSLKSDGPGYILSAKADIANSSNLT